MTKDEAISAFRALTRRYGLQWTANVPREAWDQMREINRHMTEADRRAALGLRP